MSERPSTKPVDMFWVRGGDMMYRRQRSMDSASCNCLLLSLLFSYFFFPLFHQKKSCISAFYKKSGMDFILILQSMKNK